MNFLGSCSASSPTCRLVVSVQYCLLLYPSNRGYKSVYLTFRITSHEQVFAICVISIHETSRNWRCIYYILLLVYMPKYGNFNSKNRIFSLVKTNLDLNFL